MPVSQEREIYMSTIAEEIASHGYRDGVESNELFDQCELCIVGAGIGGLNALFAACQYLDQDSKVILVDKNSICGGMWIDTYDYVRLHQPHRLFTVGDIPWTITRSPEYLATKLEVLDYLQHCLELMRKKVRLVEYYGCELTTTSELVQDGSCHVEIDFRRGSGENELLHVKAQRCIKVFGHRIKPIPPLTLSSDQVVSLSPHQICSMNTDQSHSEKPIYLIGGGKTAMDTATEILTRFPDRKVTMVVGKGVFFINRNKLFPTGYKRWFGGLFPSSLFNDMTMRFDGLNEASILDYFRESYCVYLKNSFEHQEFAILSEEENDFIKSRLHGVVDGYLSDVLDVGGIPTILLDSNTQMPVEAGSFIVNCTGYLHREQHPYEPYCSKYGAILSVQATSMVFPLTTYSAYFLTHLLFLGKLKKLPLYELDIFSIRARNMTTKIFTIQTLMLYNLLVISEAVPLRVMLRFSANLDRWYPKLRLIIPTLKMVLNRRIHINHCRISLDRVRERFQIRCAILGEVLPHQGKENGNSQG